MAARDHDGLARAGHFLAECGEFVLPVLHFDCLHGSSFPVRSIYSTLLHPTGKHRGPSRASTT